jgi:uncharacterized membrane protein YgcG
VTVPAWLAGTRRRHAILVALLLQARALQIPPPRGYVNDFADVLPAASETRIERIVEDVRAKSGGEIVVVTLPRSAAAPSKK